MNAGLLRKAIRELAWPTAVFALALLAVQVLLGWVMPGLVEDFAATLLQSGFVRNIVRAIFGADVADQIDPSMFGVLSWAHPVVLMIVAGHAIVGCTRVPAGEIDRGTADVLLGLPVSRWQVHRAEAVAWLGSAFVVVLFGFTGNVIGNALVPAGDQLDGRTRLHIAINLLLLIASLGGVTSLVSAASVRRGRAMGIAFGIMLASMLATYLAQFVAVVEHISVASVLRYYNPLRVHRAGRLPIGDLAVLGAVAAVAWSIAGCVFARRDLPVD